jgi:hypothetical protein
VQVRDSRGVRFVDEVRVLPRCAAGLAEGGEARRWLVGRAR